MEAKKPMIRDKILFVREAIIPYRGRKVCARAVRTYGSTDVLLIIEEIPDGDTMGQAEKLDPKATAATMSPSTTAVTSPPSAASTPSSPHVAASAHNQPSFPAHRQQEGHAHPENAQEKVAVVPEKIVEITVERIEDLKKDEFKTRALKCLKFLFVFVGVVCVSLALALIVVSILTCIATKAYDADQSGRIVAMVLLAVTAALTICSIIYMQVATFRCETKRMILACGGIVMLIIIQILIGGISVNVEPADEVKLMKALTESFKLAKKDVPRPYKLWAMTQYDLTCCGLYGPDDYKTSNEPYYFPPEVPISCCPSYDPSRSELLQEKERQICKTKKSFYKIGCKDEVVKVFNETATIVLTVNVALVIAQTILMILALTLAKKMKTIDILVCHTRK